MEALVVSREESGQKLLAFLERRVQAAPAECMRWLRTGQVRLNGGRIKPFARVAEGDKVRIPPFAQLHGAAAGSVLAPFSHAVFEDEELLALCKPAGLPTQGGSGHTDSLASRLATHFAGCPFVPAPAHRLDKSTSGLVLAGKTYACQRALQDDLAAGHIIKEYLAWVNGIWIAPSVLMEDYMRKEMAKDGKERMALVPALKEGALPAAAHATLLRTLPDKSASLLLLRLFTGRTHQLRVQLAGRGHPIVGDGKYGQAGAFAAGLKLHACRIVWQSHTFTLLPVWAAPFQVSALPPL